MKEKNLWDRIILAGEFREGKGATVTKINYTDTLNNQREILNKIIYVSYISPNLFNFVIITQKE